MTEPVEITNSRLFINAICLFGQVQVRLIDDFSILEGYDFADCNVLTNSDETDCAITWGTERQGLTPFVGKKLRLHLRADNATSLFSYRFGAAPS